MQANTNNCKENKDQWFSNRAPRSAMELRSVANGSVDAFSNDLC
jgi:hypothetical protein